jgi:hypothetical protein
MIDYIKKLKEMNLVILILLTLSIFGLSSYFYSVNSHYNPNIADYLNGVMNELGTITGINGNSNFENVSYSPIYAILSIIAFLFALFLTYLVILKIIKERK